MLTPKAYLGKEPYIFISYAHKDKSTVYPFIIALQKRYNVWFDEGIGFGKEWDNEITEKLLNCSVFLYMITENSLESRNCNDEINFAREEGKIFVNIVVSHKTILPPTIRFRYGRYQMMYLDDFTNMEDAIGRLAERCPEIKAVEHDIHTNSNYFENKPKPKVNIQSSYSSINKDGKYNIYFKGFDKRNETNIIKALKLIGGFYIHEAKAITNNVPCIIKHGISIDECNKIVSELRKAGGEVEIEKTTDALTDDAEKYSYNVSLIGYDVSKELGIIRAINTVNNGFSYDDAASLLSNLPKLLVGNVDKQECDKIVSTLKTAGGNIIINREPILRGTAPNANSYTIYLNNYDRTNKLIVVKEIRDALGIELGSAKALADEVPCILTEGLNKTDCDRIVKSLKDVGCRVSVELDELSNDNKKATYIVKLLEYAPSNKIAIVNAIKTVLNVTLGDAHALGTKVPSIIANCVSKKESDKIVAALEKAGGKVKVIQRTPMT